MSETGRTASAAPPKRRTVIHEAYRIRVPYRASDFDPVAILWAAQGLALESVEPGIVDALKHGWVPGVDDEMRLLLLNDVHVRITEEWPTISPDYRFAAVEVLGEWVTGDGNCHVFGPEGRCESQRARVEDEQGRDDSAGSEPALPASRGLPA